MRCLWLVQLEAADQIALIAAGFSQLLCLRIASDFIAATAAATSTMYPDVSGSRLLPIGGGLGVMLPSNLVDRRQQACSTTHDSTPDHIYSIFESIVQFSVELSKLDLDLTEMAMFAAATLVQPGDRLHFIIIMNVS